MLGEDSLFIYSFIRSHYLGVIIPWKRKVRTQFDEIKTHFSSYGITFEIVDSVLNILTVLTFLFQMAVSLCLELCWKFSLKKKKSGKKKPWSIGLIELLIRKLWQPRTKALISWNQSSSKATSKHPAFITLNNFILQMSK